MSMLWKHSVLFIFSCHAVRLEFSANREHEVCNLTPVKWRLCDDQKDPIAFTSNLDNQGPDNKEPDSPKEFRMKEIAEVGGTKLDLVITVADGETYKSYAVSEAPPEKKGYGGAYVSPCPSGICTHKPDPQKTGNCFGHIPFHVHSHTKFHWKWVKSQTSEVFPLQRFEITFYELDHERDNWDSPNPDSGPDHEFIKFNTPVSTITHGPRVEQIDHPDGTRTIQSKEQGTWGDNPSKLGQLFAVQTERTVTVSYENLGEWDVTFGHTGPNPAGQKWDRVIEFSGMVYPCAPPSQEPCPPERRVNWRLCNDQKDAIEFYSNLAGGGPHTSDPKEFRMKEIAYVDGTQLDLVITVPDTESYKSFAQEKKKDFGGAYVSPCPNESCTKRPDPQRTGYCWVHIPFHVHSHTKFHWKWVKSGESEPVPINYFEVLFYELDRERNDWDGEGPDNEYLEFNTPVSNISHNSRVKQIELADGTHRIESTEMGVWEDNPSKVWPITHLQTERAVTVTYQNLGEWYVTFGHEGPKTQRFDRVIEFTGIVCPAKPLCVAQKLVPWRMCNDQKGPMEFHSNLAGKGPHKGPDSPHEFRMKKLATVNGTVLDLVITVADDETYTSFAVEEEKGYGGALVSPCPEDKCGVYPNTDPNAKQPKPDPQNTGRCYGHIPFRVQTQTKFRYKWVEEDALATSKAFPVSRFEMTFYELDHEPWGADGGKVNNEYIDFNTPVSKMTIGSTEAVESTTADDGKTQRIQSKQEGVWTDNPSKVAEMTDIQTNRAVIVVYENLGEWYLTFGHKSEKEMNFDRVIEFTGGVYTC